jgi:very-short-patch-repair endonuclease
MTDSERFVWQRLRKRQFAGHRFRRQHPIGNYIVDFVCLEARLILEFDGGQHAKQRDEDAERTRRLEALGFRVLRFWNTDALKEWDAVESVIIEAIEAASPSSLSRQACAFTVGDQVRFSPSARTRGLYQDIERFGVRIGNVYKILEIKDGMYLYFDSGVGGWPWNEFTLAAGVESSSGRTEAGRG